MRSFDFSPLYRSTVGFDHLFDMLDQTRDETVPNGPPYNVEKCGDDRYRIVMAVAGFSPEEIEIVHLENSLTIAGHKQPEDEGSQYLHRGIATRDFRQTFNLADYVTVTGAQLESGLLSIDLTREVPEAMRPRRIQIAAGDALKPIEHDKAA